MSYVTDEVFTPAVAAEKKRILAELRSIADEAKGRSFTVKERNTVERHTDRLGEMKNMSLGRQTEHDNLSGGGGKLSKLTSNLTRLELSGRRFADMFGKDSLSTDGWTSFDEYLRVINSGLHHPGLRPAIEALSHGESSATSGGHMVPGEFAAMMLDVALEDEIVRPRAHIEPMSTNSKKIADFDGLTHTSGTLYGGVHAQWLGEGQTATDQDTALRAIEFKAEKLAIFSKVSNELLADSGQFEGMLGQVLAKACSWELDRAFLTGTGAGQPLGILNANSVIDVSKESGQASASIVYENLTKMFARMHPACVRNSVWVANPTTIPQLLSLSVVIGTGGAYMPVLTQGDLGFTMLTRPVIFTEKVPTLSTRGDLMLVDFSQYIVGMRREVTLEKSVHVGWQSDQSGFRTILRANGQPKWHKVCTPLNGDTLSWCVTLETR